MDIAKLGSWAISIIQTSDAGGLGDQRVFWLEQIALVVENTSTHSNRFVDTVQSSIKNGVKLSQANHIIFGTYLWYCAAILTNTNSQYFLEFFNSFNQFHTCMYAYKQIYNSSSSTSAYNKAGIHLIMAMIEYPWPHTHKSYWNTLHNIVHDVC